MSTSLEFLAEVTNDSSAGRFGGHVRRRMALQRSWEHRGTLDAFVRVVGLEPDFRGGTMTARPSPWAVLLAGGDGRRLTAETRDPSGRHVPKQFFHAGDRPSLLERTLERTARLVDPERILIVVRAAHRPFWERKVDCPESNLVVQPHNRGTGIALLHAMRHVLARDRDPCCVFFPTDCDVEDAEVWNASVREAVAVAAESRDHAALVGVEPQDDPDFGWILPGPEAADRTHAVRGFMEKPDAGAAKALARQGALCNSFVFACTCTALFTLYAKHAPGVIARHGEVVGLARQMSGGFAAAFATLPFHDFCRDLLTHATADLRLVRAGPCRWTDLGTPSRLARWLERNPAWRSVATARAVDPSSTEPTHDDPAPVAAPLRQPPALDQARGAHEPFTGRPNSTDARSAGTCIGENEGDAPWQSVRG